MEENMRPDAPAVPQKNVSEVLTTDEFAGKGGSYVFDPVSGTRTRVEGPEDDPAVQPEA